MRRSIGKAAVAGMAAGTVLLLVEAIYALARPAPRFDEFNASGADESSGLPPLKLAVIGDSTTTGPGLETAEDIWIRQLARRLADRFRVEVISFAQGGSTVVDLFHRQLAPAIAVGADITFIAVGTNDALRGVPARSFERTLEAVVSGLVGDLSTVPRLLPPLDQVMRSRGRAIDAAHARVAGRHGAIKVDTWAGASQEFRTNPAIFSADLMHPTAAGHTVWAETVYQAIEPFLDDLFGSRIGTD